MGLDTSHDCWHGSYGSFSAFRDALARAAGFAVWKVQYDGGHMAPLTMVDWGHLGTEAHLRGDWSDGMPVSDPILYLIVHSDCDGEIRPEQGAPLAKRIRELLPLLPDADENGKWLRMKAEKFAAGLELAAANNDPVDFH